MFLLRLVLQVHNKDDDAKKKSWAKLNWMFAISLFCLMLFLAAFDKKVHGGPRNKTDDD